MEWNYPLTDKHNKWSYEYFMECIYNFGLIIYRERLLNELRETEEASRRQAEVLVKVSLVGNGCTQTWN